MEQGAGVEPAPWHDGRGNYLAAAWAGGASGFEGWAA